MTKGGPQIPQILVAQDNLSSVDIFGERQLRLKEIRGDKLVNLGLGIILKLELGPRVAF